MFSESIAAFAFFGNKIVLVTLLLGSVLNVGFYLARRAFFAKHFLRDPRALLDAVSGAKNRGEIVSLLEKTKTEETQLVLRGLAAHPDSSRDFQSAVEGQVTTEQVYWDASTSLFAWTSATGPMMGLLGTILGLMKAFSDLASAEIPEPQLALAGIADALLTTVLGILLAIPATAFFNHCRLRSRKARAAVSSLTQVIAARFGSVEPRRQADPPRQDDEPRESHTTEAR